MFCGDGSGSATCQYENPHACQFFETSNEEFLLEYYLATLLGDGGDVMQLALLEVMLRAPILLTSRPPGCNMEAFPWSCSASVCPTL